MTQITEEKIAAVRATIRKQSIETNEHIFMKHFLLRDFQLQDRVKSGETTTASKFTCSLQDADKIIKNELLYTDDFVNTPKMIAEWLYNNDTESIEILGTAEDYIGKAYTGFRWHDWNKGAIKCNQFIVVVRRIFNKQGEDTFDIGNAYPILPDEDEDIEYEP